MSADNTHDDATVLPHQIYVEVLRTHAIALIWMGYQRLVPSTLTISDEDEITDELIEQINLARQDPTSPDWVDHYEVHEQRRKRADGKRGKDRPIMDIEIECHRRGPRPRLGFEAKRLGRGNGIGGYLGDEGMRAFLSGYYPTPNGEGGMLGYVQERTPREWSAKLNKGLADNRESYRFRTSGDWQPMDISSMLLWCCSDHTSEKGSAISVLHVLLSFT